MTNGNCYNFDWFVDWIKRNVFENKSVELETSAKYVAKNFSRCFFNVSEQDVISAFEIIGYERHHKDGESLYKLDRDSNAFKEFAKHFD